MQSNSRCRQVSHLPHKQPRRPRDPSAPPEPSQRSKCQACHAECTSMSPSARPAMQNEGRWCHQAPRLPRKHPRRPQDISAPPEPSLCRTCHTCHAERRSMSPRATPATQNEGRCHQAPRLPRRMKIDVAKCHRPHKQPRRPRDTSTPPEPSKCHKRHAKCASMSPSATPAMQSEKSLSPSATPAIEILSRIPSDVYSTMLCIIPSDTLPGFDTKSE